MGRYVGAKSRQEFFGESTYHFLVSPTSEDLVFLGELHDHLSARRKVQPGKTRLALSFENSRLPKTFWGFALTVYQPGRQRIMVVRIKNELPFENIRKVVNSLLRHERIDEFDFIDRQRCRVQIDFINSEPVQLDLECLSDNSLGADRFEVGVDGLRVSNGERTRYFLPGDAYVASILSFNQLYRYLRRLFPKVALDELSCGRLRTDSFVSWKDDWLPMYRGIPMIGEVTDEKIEAAAVAATHWIIRTMKPDGRVEYYYDAATDSGWDHQHPKRDPITNPYYNLLRHCGGAITAMWCDEYRKEKILRPQVESIIGFYLEQLVSYKTLTGDDAAYAYYNRKAKLGGSGLGLLVLGTYQRLYGVSKYKDKARLLATHLVNEIRKDGEFRYYHVYLGEKVSMKRNPELFSFYYPGEALIGLASYCQFVCDSDEERRDILSKVHKAITYLLVDRPKYYAQYFESLPSDAWLMMAINDLWDLPDFQTDLYKRFVFDEADQMVDHMYTEENAVLPDYVGSFYYEYGDHAYPDGARGEGLLAAYLLARKVKDYDRVERYHRAVRRLMWATLRLCNTAESMYCVPNPGHSVGGIRFKLTRQWFRVDTIQHVASFYLKYLLSIRDNSI